MVLFDIKCTFNLSNFILEKIGIKELRDLYEKFFKENNKFLNKKVVSFNYLNLSILYSRDNREFDINNFKLLNQLIKKAPGKI